MTDNAPRAASIKRTTRETDISVEINLDGTGRSAISTGIGFFDHMLASLALHARLDLTIECKGDLEVDDHHTVEDVGLALGEAVLSALGDRAGIRRFASTCAPLDESLSRCVIDISGRPGAWIDLRFERERLGELSCENIPHFFQSFASAARITLHLDLIRGENDHHKAESAFKAFALALRESVARDADGIPSTKGVLG